MSSHTTSVNSARIQQQISRVPYLQRCFGVIMATIKEQIELIRAEIDKTQKNKATNAHIGKLKAKIAQLKLKEEKAHAHSKASGGGKGFEVKKSGDATVALVEIGRAHVRTPVTA